MLHFRWSDTLILMKQTQLSALFLHFKAVSKYLKFENLFSFVQNERKQSYKTKSKFACSLRSSLYRFLSGKRELREDTGTAGTTPTPPPPRSKFFALTPCLARLTPRLSLSTAKRKRNRLLRRLVCMQLS